MSDGQAILSTSELRFGYPGHTEFLGPLSLNIAPGTFWGVIGPNGAGKSTLLRLCVSILAPTGGTVRLEGCDPARLAPIDRARRLAFLPQHPITPSGATAREIALLGRYPHRTSRIFESKDDFRIAETALARTETLEFADRPMETLSGGEAQRVHLAAALAQQPRMLVLDEPTAALDPYHQLHILSILSCLVRDQGLAVLAATHDLNLAGRFCDRLLLLSDGRAAGCGPPDEVLEPTLLERVYRVPFRALRDEATGQRLVWPVAGGIGDPPPREGRP